MAIGESNELIEGLFFGIGLRLEPSRPTQFEIQISVKTVSSTKAYFHCYSISHPLKLPLVPPSEDLKIQSMCWSSQRPIWMND